MFCSFADPIGAAQLLLANSFKIAPGGAWKSSTVPGIKPMPTACKVCPQSFTFTNVYSIPSLKNYLPVS